MCRSVVGCRDDILNTYQHEAEHSQLFLQPIKTQDPHIQFTTEELNITDGSLPFLDTQVTPGPSSTSLLWSTGNLHTVQYLHWDSYLYTRAKQCLQSKLVSHNKDALQKELQDIRNGLQACQFQTCTLNRLQQKF